VSLHVVLAAGIEGQCSLRRAVHQHQTSRLRLLRTSDLEHARCTGGAWSCCATFDAVVACWWRDLAMGNDCPGVERCHQHFCTMRGSCMRMRVEAFLCVDCSRYRHSHFRLRGLPQW
jgi:hypothetical protein